MNRQMAFDDYEAEAPAGDDSQRDGPQNPSPSMGTINSMLSQIVPGHPRAGTIDALLAQIGPSGIDSETIDALLSDISTWERCLQEEQDSSASSEPGNSGMGNIDALIEMYHSPARPDNAVAFKRLHPDARLPTRGTPGSAGLDLRSNVRIVIRPKVRAKISIGLAVELPEGCFGKIVDKSSVALNFGLEVKAGVIDNDYRGEIFVVLYNPTRRVVIIEQGDCIAQMLILKYEHYEPVFVDTLSATSRGAGGFGSTLRK